MNFKWITHRREDRSGNMREEHHIVSTDTGRSYGNVKSPIGGELFYQAEPWSGGMADYDYLDLDSAKAYIELCAMTIAEQEDENFKKHYAKMTAEPKPESEFTPEPKPTEQGVLE